MPQRAVLLMDLQVDFLDESTGRMPVGALAAERVLERANAVLRGEAVVGSLVVAIANAFPRSQFLGNFFRNQAAVEGSSGASLDPRLQASEHVPVFRKSASSAFSIPQLHPFLQAQDVRTLVLIGVFAEGCVRATAVQARRLGYEVVAPLDSIATNGRLKLAFALSSMRRNGVALPQRLAEVGKAA